MRDAAFGFVITAYFAVAATLLVRLGFGLLGSWRLRASARPYVGANYGASFPVLTSDRVRTAVATGVIDRRVILPVSATDWSEAQSRAAILHEQEHLRRWDPLWLGVGALVQALLWINPLVWWLGSLQLRNAEQATDDRVLGLGVEPHAYAQVLLDMAKEARGVGSRGVLVAAMVRKSGLARRVKRILANQSRRGYVEPTSLAITVAAFVLIAGWGRGYGVRVLAKFVGGGGQNSAAPPRQQVDESNAGTDRNDFLVRAEDGRSVQLIQIQRWTHAGIEAWKPDGSPVPSADRIPENFDRHDPAELHFFTKFQSTAKPRDINGGLGSSPFPEPGHPPMETFSGGYVRRIDPREPGSRLAVSFIEPIVGTSGTSSYRFGLADKTWIPLKRVLVSLAEIQAVSAPDCVRQILGPEFDSPFKVAPDTAEVFVHDAKGNPVPDGHRGDKRSPMHVTSLWFTHSTSALGVIEIVPHAFGIDGKTLEPVWNDQKQDGGAYTRRWCWKEPMSEIGFIQIDGRVAIHADFLHVRLRMKGATTP
jgi:hypothetical protein